MKRFRGFVLLLCVASAASVVALGVFFFTLSPERGDVATLLGSALGASIGLFALILGAEYTILGQRQLERERANLAHVSLLIAIWSEVRPVMEYVHLFIVRMIESRHETGIEGGEGGWSDHLTEFMRKCSLLELSLLNTSMQTIGHFDYEIREALVNLHFEFRIWKLSLDSMRPGEAMDAGELDDLIKWTVSVLRSLLIARVLIAEMVRLRDVLKVEAGVLDQFRDQDLTHIFEVFTFLNREKLHTGVHLPVGVFKKSKLLPSELKTRV